MNLQIPIKNLPQEIIKLVNNYIDPESEANEIINIICLQKEINELLSAVIINHYNVVPVETELIIQEEQIPDKMDMNKVFEVATKQAIDKFKVKRDPNWTPFDEPIEVIPEPIQENKHDKIYIIDLPLGKYAITSYQFEHKEFEKGYGPHISILGEIDLDKWTTQNIDNLNKYPELRDKLVLDKLKYEDFLTLEGWEDADLETKKIFDDITTGNTGKELTLETPKPFNYELDPDEITPFDNIDGVLISEIKENSEMSDFIEDMNKVFEKSSEPVDNWVPEVVKVSHQVEIEPVPVKEPKPVFNLTPHQQIKFDGLIEKINNILASQRNLVRQPNPAYYMTVLEGAAGTGKTTMMKRVLGNLLEDDYKIIFCSPTHQALGVIRETLKEEELPFTESNDEYLMGEYNLIIKTLASFLGIKMQRDEENGTESFVEDPKAPILTCDILAIDESSMVSRDQLKILVRKLHINAKCILFIGDEVQLDSPSDNNESNGIFQLPQKFALEEVVRQAAGNTILQFAWELREYIMSKNCNFYPSQLLNPQRSNENIIILNDQVQFIEHYFQNESKSKLIASYTNKTVNEYNDYVRQMRLTGYGTPLDINIDGNGKNIITNWDELREWYVGEELVLLEPNQRGGDTVHQTGERAIIREISEEIKKVSVQTMNENDVFTDSIQQEYEIPYWRIVDTNGKIIWVVKKEYIEQYNVLLQLLSIEAKKMTSKHRWSKFFGIKEKFVRVNKTYAFTLHKLQGSTCEDIYVDARDLNKFWQRMQIGVYKLIYIALTRPKNRVIFLT